MCIRKISLHFQPQVQQHFVDLFSDQRSTWHGISRIDCFQQRTKFSIFYYTVREVCTSNEYCQFVSYRLISPTCSVIFTRESFARCHLGLYQTNGFLNLCFLRLCPLSFLSIIFLQVFLVLKRMAVLQVSSQIGRVLLCDGMATELCGCA